nr:unnamed protein product [Callosobruchus analis]
MWLPTLVFSYFLINGCRTTENENIQNNTELFSKYAEVVKWGTEPDKKHENTMVHAGQSLWSQSVDANVAENSSFDNREPIFRQYPVYRKSSNDYEKVDKARGVGEIIQDRFSVRPYKGYGQIHSTSAYNPPQNLPAFDSYSVAATQSPSSNLYTSTYDSYNPPSNVKPNESLEKYPPLLQDSHVATPVQDQRAKYESPKHETLGPPLSPEKDFGPAISDQEYDDNEGLSNDETHSPKDTGGIYYPPDFGGEMENPEGPGSNTGGKCSALFNGTVTHVSLQH